MYKATAFIGGVEVSCDEIQIISPIDGQVVGTIPALSEQHIEEAFSSAREAFDKWKRVDYKTRIKYLLSFAAKLRENMFALSQILNLEIGKDMKSANDEIMRSYDYIVESTHAYADLIERADEYNHNNNILVPKDIHATYIRVPLGVALTISPFNYPVNLMITKIVPAILSGNTVVHKSATNGSLCGWYIAKLFHETTVDGFLATPGIFNYVTGRGSEIGKWIIKHQNVDAFSFTGSTDVGRSIVVGLPDGIPVQMELGGHNPAIVFDDADLDLAVQEVIKGAFSFSGQRCTSIKRLFVHKKIYADVLEKLKVAVFEVQLKEPLINKKVVEELKIAYKDALDKGAQLIGGSLTVDGNFVSPVVFAGVSEGMKLFNEEVFAPVLAITPFEEEDELVKFCNDSKFGLQSAIFTKNIERATDLALKLEFGRVNINTLPARSPDVLPFGGIKASGCGLQSIKDSLLFFTSAKGIVLKVLEEERRE
ncbi:NADP-dependent glyceraldehyde-3-phosphate dehydrogenase [Candidatus Mycoplasma haematohominis]|uniref:NADP-dependent glyceraldehyde-3-phosphate dehydrogenase n=1 Tax=Candidatus Mycoplasma haematohominis TaxID=1494318 RepID=A0A478FT22_9MOLU|nr:NADP-dependent glyceraldehyde-3-phosphate dehydrogenase [Candidatus Mycoplasma haemohominis]